MKTKLVLLGTGTPNACPNANGPSSAVVVGDRGYIVDFGPGVVRQASAAYFNGIDALRPDLLTVAFCTHLHTDHTAGYPDLIFTPWVLERPVPLKVFGPKGMQHMTDYILKAYETDIDFRINGFEKANESGYRVEVTEIESGIIYKEFADRLQVVMEQQIGNAQFTIDEFASMMGLGDRKSTRLNSSHRSQSRMPSSA